MLLQLIVLVLVSSVGADDDPDNPCLTADHGVYTHPEECQLFYNCASFVDQVLLGNTINECPYPDVFNPKTRACEDFHKVDCGSRKIVYNGCDYYKEKNGCNGPNCRPCVYGVDYPECGGLPDGAYVIPELKNSPFYAVCDSGRGLKHECPFDANGMRMIFDGEQKKCVQA